MDLPREAGSESSGVCALWHFRLAGSCSLSVGGWAPSGAANPGLPVLAAGWADFFLVFDVGAGSELWGRLGHDRIETAWLRAFGDFLAREGRGGSGPSFGSGRRRFLFAKFFLT